MIIKSVWFCFHRNPVKCGQTIRLTHVATKRNLHSHRFSSPLSRNLEVSAFGEEGEGDEGEFILTHLSWNSTTKLQDYLLTAKKILSMAYVVLTSC